jgi:hypothetical protein
MNESLIDPVNGRAGRNAFLYARELAAVRQPGERARALMAVRLKAEASRRVGPRPVGTGETSGGKRALFEAAGHALVVLGALELVGLLVLALMMIAVGTGIGLAEDGLAGAVIGFAAGLAGAVFAGAAGGVFGIPRPATASRRRFENQIERRPPGSCAAELADALARTTGSGAYLLVTDRRAAVLRDRWGIRELFRGASSAGDRFELLWDVPLDAVADCALGRRGPWSALGDGSELVVTFADGSGVVLVGGRPREVRTIAQALSAAGQPTVPH